MRITPFLEHNRLRNNLGDLRIFPILSAALTGGQREPVFMWL